MKKIIMVALIAMIILSGCQSIKDKYNDEETRAKIKALIEKYNTPDNQDKLADAIEKLMKENK